LKIEYIIRKQLQIKQEQIKPIISQKIAQEANGNSV